MNNDDMILISVDDHIIEPPNMFVNHLPAKYKDDDSMWPGAPEELGAVLADADVPDDEINKMTHENACRWYSFDPFKHMPRENATVGALRKAAAGHDTSIQARSHHTLDAADKLGNFQDQLAAASSQLT